MNPLVAKLRKQGVGVLTIDNPPVNALTAELRSALLDAILEMRADPSVTAIVLSAAGKTFIAGADIREFDGPPREPSLRSVIAALEEGDKPVVAAIGGVALGGGLEVALACDARIVTARARLGLPEVKIGILPGSGGTQRLPRLISPSRALRMIATGDPVAAGAAGAIGLADRVTDDENLIQEAVALADSLAATGRIRLSERTIDPSERADFDLAATEIARTDIGAEQMRAIITSVEAAFGSFEDGLAIERRHFETLKVSARARALRHLFFAERESGKLGTADAALAINSVGVIGGGTMGCGIAMAFANAGLSVALLETEVAAADRAKDRIAALYGQSVRRGSLSADEAERRMGRITASADDSCLAQSDLVIEAVFEEMQLKRDLFARLASITRSDAILATNTSYLDVDEIAQASGVPERVAGMHFFSPANVMKLVEVVHAAQSAPQTVATIVQLARRLGKVPVVVGNAYGFVGNRMLTRRSEQIDRLLLDGASPQEIDDAIKAYGFKMGPCAASDLAGLDISWRMRRATGRKAPAADALVEAGRLGQKAGRGYFAYAEDGRSAASDPEVLSIIQSVSREMGIERRAIDPDEIVDRIILPMVNEGARILDEGIARSAADIDVVWVNGYGFPRWRGGPMHDAESRGLESVAARLTELAESLGDTSLLPSDRLIRSLGSGRFDQKETNANG